MFTTQILFNVMSLLKLLIKRNGNTTATTAADEPSLACEICLQRRQACLRTSPRDTALCEQWGQGVPDINPEQRSEVTEHYCQPLAFCSILSSASNLFSNCLWHKSRSGPFHLQIKLPVTLHRSEANLLFFPVQSLPVTWGPKKLNSSEEGNFSAVRDIRGRLTFTLEYITFHTRHGICDINFIDGKHIQGLNHLDIKQSRLRTLIMPKTVSCFWKHKTLPSTSPFFHARAWLGWVNGKINSLHASMKWEGIFLARPVPSLLLF